MNEQQASDEIVKPEDVYMRPADIAEFEKRLLNNFAQRLADAVERDVEAMNKEASDHV